MADVLENAKSIQRHEAEKTSVYIRLSLLEDLIAMIEGLQLELEAAADTEIQMQSELSKKGET